MLTTSNEAGIDRVRRDKYAFILPHLIGEYIALQPPCDLTTVDSFLMNRGYALALPKGSSYLQPFNRALRTLRLSGVLDRLRDKWWAMHDDCRAVVGVGGGVGMGGERWRKGRTYGGVGEGDEGGEGEGEREGVGGGWWPVWSRGSGGRGCGGGWGGGVGVLVVMILSNGLSRKTNFILKPFCAWV